VNGVSALHSELLKKEVLKDFYTMAPEKFVSITNGVTPRRWLKLYSPALSDLISQKIGNGWITRMEEELGKLESYAQDREFQQKWQEIKHRYKLELGQQISTFAGVRPDASTLFDIMVKRIHEYKRQTLNILHVIHLYNKIKRNPGTDLQPRTSIFGGKAAPGYHMAKLIIKLIHEVGDVVNNDPDVNGRLKVIFFPDFNVKNSEWVYRAADLSEQISTAGKEASGTGNMKFAMNGALTIGTMDGANIEIMEAVGKENFFLFGLTVEQIKEKKAAGYNPYEIYQSDQDVKEVVDRLLAGEFSRGDKALYRPLVDSLLGQDPYFVLQDFGSYAECQQRVSDSFRNPAQWTTMSILNVARMGRFSSDRSIREYCEKVWHLKPPH